MPSVTVHPRPAQWKTSNPSNYSSTTTTATTTNPLPKLLQTPSGLAIVEVQGTFNIPQQDEDEIDNNDDNTSSSAKDTTIGRLVFPNYDPSNEDADTAWMKRVYLYIGKHQRMTGEVKKLAKPLAVLRRRQGRGGGGGGGGGGGAQNGDGGNAEGEEDGEDDLEIAEIVRFKILFASRPEPVGVATEV